MQALARREAGCKNATGRAMALPNAGGGESKRRSNCKGAKRNPGDRQNKSGAMARGNNGTPQEGRPVAPPSPPRPPSSLFCLDFSLGAKLSVWLGQCEPFSPPFISHWMILRFTVVFMSRRGSVIALSQTALTRAVW